MKAFPWKCMHCRETAVVPTTLPTYTTELDHDGRAYSISIRDFSVYQCGNCGEIVLNDEANAKITDALRREVGLLQPAEIREKRQSLSLAEDQLANLLDVSEASLKRWEAGEQLQPLCVDTFLRAFFDVRELQNYLSNSQSNVQNRWITAQAESSSA